MSSIVDFKNPVRDGQVDTSPDQRNYNLPRLRFENGTLKDPVESEKRERYVPMDVVFVYVAPRGETKTEVPYIAKKPRYVPAITQQVVRKTVPVQVIYEDEKGMRRTETKHEEKEVMEDVTTWEKEDSFPWLETIRYKVDNGLLPPAYLEGCQKALENWLQHGSVPVDGYPVDDWTYLSPAQIELFKSLDILSVEQVSEMTEDAMKEFGYGARDLKKKAGEWLLAGKDQNAVVARFAAQDAKLSAYEQEVERLQAQIDELQDSKSDKVESDEEDTEVE